MQLISVRFRAFHPRYSLVMNESRTVTFSEFQNASLVIRRELEISTFRAPSNEYPPTSRRPSTFMSSQFIAK